tara:strand:+ start:311 stop:433 length:123 start_codon:yes stop_codon:yes gene_type:complete
MFSFAYSEKEIFDITVDNLIEVKSEMNNLHKFVNFAVFVF